MSKIPGAPPTAEGLRRNHHFTVYYSDKFQTWVARRARTGQGKDTPKRAQARADLTLATQLVKNPNASDVDAAMKLQVNSPFTYKDLLISAAYGKLNSATLRDGTVLRSAREMTSEIQQMLDLITNKPGSLLVRLSDGWYGIDPGTDNQVLTINAESGFPDWLDAQGGGGGGTALSFFAMPDLDTNHSSQFSYGTFGGKTFISPAAITVDRIGFWPVSVSAGCLVAASVYGLTGNVPTNLLATGPQITPVAGQINYAHFGQDIVLSPGLPIFFGLTIAGGNLFIAQQGQLPTGHFTTTYPPPSTAPAISSAYEPWGSFWLAVKSS